MSWVELLQEDRRLAILRVLHDQPGLCLNDSVIHVALERLGHTVGRDTVRSDMAWLQDVGTVVTEEVAGRVLVAKLTQRGEDVALGRTKIPGIKKPNPRY